MKVCSSKTCFFFFNSNITCNFELYILSFAGAHCLFYISAKLHQSRTERMARRNTCFLSQPMDATVQHCPATVPAVTGIDRPKLGQRWSSGHTVHTTDEARTALRLSKLRSIKILYTLKMIYDSLYI